MPLEGALLVDDDVPEDLVSSRTIAIPLEVLGSEDFQQAVDASRYRGGFAATWQSDPDTSDPFHVIVSTVSLFEDPEAAELLVANP